MLEGSIAAVIEVRAPAARRQQYQLAMVWTC